MCMAMHLVAIHLHKPCTLLPSICIAPHPIAINLHNPAPINWHSLAHTHLWVQHGTTCGYCVVYGYETLVILTR